MGDSTHHISILISQNKEKHPSGEKTCQNARKIVSRKISE